jgi:hypothetical protein
MSDEKTFLLELREQAKEEPSALLRSFLRDQADLIDDAIKVLAKAPTRSNMVILNGLWARGERYLMRSQERPEPEPPLAGTPEVHGEDELEEAA